MDRRAWLAVRVLLAPAPQDRRNLGGLDASRAFFTPAWASPPDAAAVETALGTLPLAPAAQDPAAPVDPLHFARLKDFAAHRVSSNHTDWRSSDDSKRPIPGETLTLADLEGPGVVKHIWITVAANEYGWPRLLRLRVYYDGSETPSVDAPLGDFFAVGHGFERSIQSLMVRSSEVGGASRRCS